MVSDCKRTFKFLETLLINEYSFKAAGRLVQRVLALCVILLLTQLLLTAVTCISLLPRVS